MIEALRRAFQRDPNPVEALFKMSTAFTQARRIELFRALKQQPQHPQQLKSSSGMPARALARHLMKLKSRGFVEVRQGKYSVAELPEAFGRALGRLAAS